MNEEMIEWYNDCVSDADRVYILGDVAFTPSVMKAVVPRLKGRKCLVPGNHEPPKMRKYFDLFDDVRGYVQRQGFIMSHIPLHPHCLGRWKLNIHGHLHNNTVKITKNKIVHGYSQGLEEIEDERYYNTCVERTNFRPKLLDEILHERGLK
jgi:calcineurin-like phosphoesterase family protein